MSLPSGYKRLEYIESTGTQYIDTRVSGGTNASFEMTARLVSTNSKNNNQFFGTVSNFCSVNGPSSYFRVEKKYSTGAVVNFTTTPATKWNLKVESDGSVYLDGALKGTISSIAGIGWGGDTYSNNIFITDDDGINYATSAELYLLKMYTDGVLVRDFIPAKRLSDNAIGLYDNVEKKFYANAGTGTFTAGPVLKPDAPSDLTSSVDGGTVTLSWSAVIGATGYKISRDGVLISTQTGLAYTETVTKGQTYTYSVVSYNDYGDSDPETLSVNVPLVPPSTPPNFAASVSGLSATLSWDAPAKATGYRLYRDGVLLSDQTDTGYTDAVEPFVSYVYTLIAYNDDGESEPATISVQVIIPPEAPPNFRASSASMTSISLAWDAVTGAENYQLSRDGAVIYTGSYPSYTDRGLTSETAYTYTLFAVNTAGSSAETTLEATTTQLILVTDRTAADVAAQNAKGTYNASDLNRVGEAMNYVAGRLRSAGYDPHISHKTDWKGGDWMTPATQAVYLGDLADLRKQFTMLESTPGVPPRILATTINSGDGLTYTWANDIEQILMDIDVLLTNIAAGWLYPGEIYSGEV